MKAPELNVSNVMGLLQHL